MFKKKNPSTFSRAHVLRLYPTDAQAHELNRFAGINRAFHNLLLEREQKKYQETGKYPGFKWLSRQCAAMKREKGLEWLRIIPAQALQKTAYELHLAFVAFFKYLAGKTEMKRGLPQFHKRSRDNSFRIPQGGFARANEASPAGFAVDQGLGRIYVPKIGWIQYRNGKKDISVYKGWGNGVPKAAVFHKKGGKWHATIFVEYKGQMPEPVKEFACPAGIDRGVKRSFQLSTGEYFNIPDCSDIDKQIKKLKRRKNRLWRKGEDGKRVRQSRLVRSLRREIIALYSRKTNIVNDFLHKLTARLSQALDFIAVEDLEIANMTKSAKGTIERPGKNVKQKRGLNRSILTQCWGRFLQFLEYKMEELGHVVVRVNPRNTSRTCPKCGYVSRENRVSQSEFVCGACGHSDNADHNASINILMRGYEAVGQIVSERERGQDSVLFPMIPAGA